MTTLVYRPDSVPGQAPATLAAGRAALAGLRIAVLDNGKPNAAHVMARLADALAERSGAKRTDVIKKGPGGRSANAAIPCAPDSFERVLAASDLVVTGTADCGSCTAYSVHDAVELERAGRPTVVVTTTRFEPIARTLAANQGLPSLRLLVLPHPIGGTDEATLNAWADAAVDTAITLYGR